MSNGSKLINRIVDWTATDFLFVFLSFPLPVTFTSHSIYKIPRQWFDLTLELVDPHVGLTPITPMSHSTHLVDKYEERKPMIPAHLRPPAAGPSRAQPPNPMQMKQEADGSWYSHHGDTSMSANTTVRSQWSAEKTEQLQQRLARRLGPEYVTQRPGPGGGPKLRSALRICCKDRADGVIATSRGGKVRPSQLDTSKTPLTSSAKPRQRDIRLQWLVVVNHTAFR